MVYIYILIHSNLYQSVSKIMPKITLSPLDLKSQEAKNHMNETNYANVISITMPPGKIILAIVITVLEWSSRKPD